MAHALEPSRPRRRIGWVLPLLLLYGGLLAASHVVRRLAPAQALPPGQLSVEVRAVDGDRLLPDRPVRLVYTDAGPDDPAAPVIVLIHGSPGRKEDLSGMIPVLAPRYRVLALDLPGFGSSTRSVPDYSIRAHAHYVAQLLERLGVPEAHVIGFSMGGGVALELYDIAPAVVRSLTLLSAIGVQELELLGDYRINHLIHGAQLTALGLLQEGVPHMGLLDGFPLNVPYARNFFDTDQRALRGILEVFQPPMLVIHGEHDFLVPPEAALEHHRLVPQSELQLLDADHFMVFVQPQATAARVAAFVDRVEAGEMPVRDAADPERQAAAQAVFDTSTLPAVHGFGLIVAMFLVAVATLVSEDLTCIAVGLIVAQGRMDFLPGVAACFIGIFVGDVLVYLAGRLLGRAALRRGPLSWFLDDERVEAASQWFRARGAVVIGLSRFLPGTRLPTYFAAGALRTGFWRFCLYFFLAVAVWTPLLVWISMLIGERSFAYFEVLRRNSLWALLLLALWILIIVKLLMPLCSHRGRRLLVGTWGRIRHFEFWPLWIFYAPVVVYVAWLGLRHRSPLLFTAVNPAMPASGVISEPKHEILLGLGGAGESLARTRRIPAGVDSTPRLELATRLLEELGCGYPVVLKPDAGQRGSGVAVVRSSAELAGYFERVHCDTLIQEYAPGVEFGVFYVRLPGEPRGRIFSVTEKKMPTVVGDGRRSLEQLILDHPRAVRMARVYLRVLAPRLREVPAAGERVQLVELGTHCRGAIFLDGSRVLSDALTSRIDAISQGYDGFFFGRYDLRAPSEDDLRSGRGFKIIELNGVTSEAAHIYDPNIGLFQAWSTLFEQWRLAFEIGRRNRDRGHHPATPRELLALIRTYRQSSRSHPT